MVKWEIRQIIDNYTKVILIVIAVSTSFLALQVSGVVPSATASGGIQKVQICDKPDSCASVSWGALTVQTNN